MRQDTNIKPQKKENPAIKKNYYIESYGCQMNFSDSEIVASVLEEQGYTQVRNYKDADLVLLNTCSIRENAEERVNNRLQEISSIKREKTESVIGIIGCMAERLKQKIFETHPYVDLIIGPDGYRNIPDLLTKAASGQKSADVILSLEETYSDINPVRLHKNGITACISIMRGCDNMCSYCIVPFTRGRERSRDPKSIILEAQKLVESGYKEVTLLGQNVNSYVWEEKSNQIKFAQLLEMVAKVNRKLRVRFSTSHPKDIDMDLLYTIKKHDNICNYIHLPLQSGSSRILKLMNRTYTGDEFMKLTENISTILPGCAISTDIIAGFCDETEDDHQKTLQMMRRVKFSMAYMFIYSERPGTPAARKLKDNVPVDIKKRRLSEIIELQQQHSLENNSTDVGMLHHVLVEGYSKKSTDYLFGRNDQNKVVVFPKGQYAPGDFVDVMVDDFTSATLKGKVVKTGIKQTNPL